MALFASTTAFFSPILPPSARTSFCSQGGRTATLAGFERGDPIHIFFGCWQRACPLVQRLRAMDMEVHDISYLYDCIERKEVLNPTPYSFSAFDAVGHSFDHELKIDSKVTLSRKASPRLPVQPPSEPSRPVYPWRASSPRFIDYIHGPSPAFDDASSQSSTSTDSQAIAELLLGCPKSFQGVQTGIKGDQLKEGRLEGTQVPIMPHDEAKNREQVGSGAEDQQQAGLAAYSGDQDALDECLWAAFEEVLPLESLEEESLEGSIKQVENPRFVPSPSPSPELPPAAPRDSPPLLIGVHTPQPIATVTVSSTPATYGSSSPKAFSPLAAPLFAETEEQEHTAIPSPVATTTHKFPFTPLSAKRAVSGQSRKEGDRPAFSSPAPSEGRRKKRARFAEPEKLVEYSSAIRVKHEEEEDHQTLPSGPATSVSPSLERHSKRSIRPSSPSSPPAPSLESISAEQPSIYSALFLPSPSPPPVPLTIDIKPIVKPQAVPKIRVADFLAQLPAWLPELRLEQEGWASVERENGDGESGEETRMVRMGLRELKKGQGGFEAKRRGR